MKRKYLITLLFAMLFFVTVPPAVTRNLSQTNIQNSGGVGFGCDDTVPSQKIQLSPFSIK